MKIHFVCGCGLENYNRKDWLCHFKGSGFLRGMRNFLLTKITLG